MSKSRELSGREQQLVSLAAAGHTDGMIASELGISKATVSTYWGRIRLKVGPYHRPELISRLMNRELEDRLADLNQKNASLIEELKKRSFPADEGLTQDQFVEVVKAAPDAILVVSGCGEIAIANDECAALFGYSPGELNGLHLEALIPQRFRESHKVKVCEYSRHPEKKRMGEHQLTFGLRKDRREIEVAASLAPIEASGQNMTICVLRIA